MNLMRVVDAYGFAQYINLDSVVAIRPTDDPSYQHLTYNSIIDYGFGYLECVYMKETMETVANMLLGRG